MSAKRVQEAKVPRTHTGATFLLAEKGPAEGDWRGRMHPKVIQDCYFWKHFCLESFFKNVLPTEGGEHIFETNMKKNDAKQECKQKCMLQLANLMQFFNKVVGG